MTQATHTPAPWRIVTDGISHWIEIEPNKIALIHAKKADRDLIAAAPEMLAALEWWQAQMRDDNCDDMGKLLDDMSAKAHAAITKARGA
jgi:hypothetical protein